eukprot:scaffold585_cov330-Pavlova_lutheri.AAC.5
MFAFSQGAGPTGTARWGRWGLRTLSHPPELGALPSRALSSGRSNKTSLADDFGPESPEHAEDLSISSV